MGTPAFHDELYEFGQRRNRSGRAPASRDNPGPIPPTRGPHHLIPISGHDPGERVPHDQEAQLVPHSSINDVGFDFGAEVPPLDRHGQG